MSFFLVVCHKSIYNDWFYRFYKETIAGETKNYLHNRAHVTGRSILDTLQDTVDDILAANARIMKILESTDALTSWKRFVNGYLYVSLYFISFRFFEYSTLIGGSIFR